MQKILKISFLAELFTYTLTIAGIIVSGTYLFTANKPIHRPIPTKESLGYIKPLGKDVRIRSDMENEWFKIYRDANVYRNDRIFTGSSSTAKIMLKESEILLIEPNSLIRLSDESNTSLYDITNGSFFAELRKGAKLLVRTNDQTSEIHSEMDATFRIVSKEKKLKLTVFKGTTKVSTLTQPAATSNNDSKKNQTPLVRKVEIVKAQHSAEIEQDQIHITPSLIALKSPEPGAVLWDQGTGTSFIWENSKANAQNTLEVSLHPEFKQKLFSKTSLSRKQHLDLQPGKVYFWRVIGENQNPEFAPTSSFSYYALKAPIIAKYSQLKTAMNSFGKTKSRILFRWDDPSMSDTYEINLAKTQDFAKIEFSEVTNKSEIHVSGLQAGTYYWRVISRFSTREDLTSITGEFALEDSQYESIMPPIAKIISPNRDIAVEQTVFETRPSAPPPPVLQKPILTDQITNFELTENKLEPSNTLPHFIKVEIPTLRWKKSSNAQFHILEISSHDDFRRVQEFLLEDQEWKWLTPEVGQFYVRIKAQRDTEHVFSAIKKMQVIVAKPKISDTHITHIPGQPAIVTATFASHHFAKLHEVQVSDVKTFTNPLITQIHGNVITQQLRYSDVKYVRIRSLNAKGWPISTFSEPYEMFLPKPEIKKPPVLAKVKEKPLRKPAVHEQTATAASVSKIIHEQEEKTHRLRMWAGLGTHYLKFTQSSNNQTGDGEFATVMAPTKMIGAEIAIDKKSKLFMEYQDRPGEISLPSGITIDKTDFLWRSLSGEYQTRILERDRSHYTALLGAQIHKIPFLYAGSSSANNLYENEMINASLGMKSVYRMPSRYEIEVMGRYQWPLTSKSSNGYQYKVSPKYIFDGSVGVSKATISGWRVGVFWFGQSHELNYQFTKDDVTSNGTQSLFNSNVQLRVGYDFWPY